MRASIPDRISGTVELQILLADRADVETIALSETVATWVRAVEAGFFGREEITATRLAAQGKMVSGRLECYRVSHAPFCTLLRIIQHFSKVKGLVENIDLFYEGLNLSEVGGTAIPSLPESTPFEVEFPDDLHAAVRVEIEFRAPLPQHEQDAIFAAMAIWDVLVEALGDEERWGEEVDCDTRLLSPAIVEHEVVGYFASFECVYFVVWLGLRLHERIAIERITIE